MSMPPGLVHDVSVIFGVQTNDSQLFLFQYYTKGDEGQPNSHADGDLPGMTQAAYVKKVKVRAPMCPLASSCGRGQCARGLV